MLDIDTIMGHIVKEEFARMGKKTTVCCITLDNGFEVIGSSACVDEKNFVEKIGQNEARAVAIDKLWELYGFAEHLSK